MWGKLKAHFGSGATWKDLAYLITKLAFGTMSFSLLVVLASIIFSFLAMPFFATFDVPIINGTWVPPLWVGILSVPLGILVLVLSLHVMNAWGWVCARWAEVMFRVATPGGQPVPVVPWAAQPGPAVPTSAAAPPAPSGPLPPPEPLVYTPAPRTRTGPDPRAVAEVAQVLVAAERPVIYAGQGVHYAEAWTQLRELAELLEAPVTTSLEGKSAFPETHPLSLGSGGRSIPKAVHHFLAERRRDLRHRLQLLDHQLRRGDAQGQDDHPRDAGPGRSQQGRARRSTR